MQILQEEIWKLSQGFFFSPLNGFWDVQINWMFLNMMMLCMNSTAKGKFKALELKLSFFIIHGWNSDMSSPRAEVIQPCQGDSLENLSLIALSFTWIGMLLRRLAA